MRVVVALGGNALLERGERPDAGTQEHRAARAARALGPVLRHHEVVLTHGNGPQVGILATESEADRSLERPFPFDVLVAQTQGMIGYWLLQALGNGGTRRVAALVSQVVVDGADPAFGDPRKFVGPTYDERTARELSAQHGWTVRPDGDTWRRVVPSPEPQELLGLDDVRALLAAGSVVVCAGGGGVPVVRAGDGTLRGVEAVVDKDLTAAVLATRLGAAALVILTDVAAVERDHGTVDARPIGRTTVAELRGLAFEAGSMGPKVEAACRFVEATGRTAAIGRLEDAEALLARRAGTIVDAG